MSESMLTAAFIILSGGLQDAYTYLCRGKVFANAQTGNIVLFSAYLFDGDWTHSRRYLVPVLSFMLGIFVAECVHRRFKHMERVHWRQLILLAEIVLLFLVGFLPQDGNTAANAQTGNIVLFSAYLFDGDWTHSRRYLVPVLSFMLGIFVAECIHRRFKHMERVHWRQLILLAEIVLLFLVGFLPQEGSTAANALVSFVCAMQVQTFRKVRGHAYASTMCIGNMRSGTEALCVYFHTHDREVLHKALTYFGVIGLFAVGAGLGALLTRAFAERGIWVSCALLAVSFLIMFIREEEAK